MGKLMKTVENKPSTPNSSEASQKPSELEKIFPLSAPLLQKWWKRERWRLLLLSKPEIKNVKS